MTVRVLLADREGSARRALASTLKAIDGVELTGEVGSRAELADALQQTHSDVLVIDDRLLRDGGGDVLAGRPTERVLVLGVDDDPAFAARARRLGAEAWIAKDCADEQLTTLLQSV
jgi:two-component system, NarL family, invasion response regulator UvrY